MSLKAVKRLAWLSAMMWLAIALQGVATVKMDRDGTPVRLRTPSPNAPAFLL